MNSPHDQETANSELPDEFQLDCSQIILIFGAILYALGCMPAIQQRGWPPINPIWDAIPYLWFTPIIISGLFKWNSDRARLGWIAAYALVTAYFDSGTLVVMSPRSVDPAGMVIATIFFYGPFHLVVAAVVEFFTQLLCRFGHSILERKPRARLLGQLMFASVVFVGTLSAPFAWREYVFASNRQEGRKSAEADWQAHQVRVFPPSNGSYRYFADLHLSYEFDPQTGFEMQRFPKFFGYREAYNGRIAELIVERGIPDWSMKRFLPKEEDLAAMLNSDTMVAVTEFPHDLTEHMVLKLVVGQDDATGQLTPGARDELEILGKGLRESVASRREQLRIGLENGKPIYVGRHPRYPETVFVRTGRRSVFAFHESGLLLALAH